MAVNPDLCTVFTTHFSIFSNTYKERSTSRGTSTATAVSAILYHGCCNDGGKAVDRLTDLLPKNTEDYYNVVDAYRVRCLCDYQMIEYQGLAIPFILKLIISIDKHRKQATDHFHFKEIALHWVATGPRTRPAGIPLHNKHVCSFFQFVLEYDQQKLIPDQCFLQNTEHRYFPVDPAS